ncbi:phage tail protein [Plesiomonas sp.]|uniref:phage tail protein n=1 Tax=Plesiomonas sp. TaxID=2486279 RepID=UPI003F3C9C32
MAAKYFAILTNLGAAKLANATALGTQLEITHMAVGDGGGSLPIPDPAQTALKGERRRAAINLLTVDPLNQNQIITEQVIPETVGGWWIREAGLFDKDGTLVAIANCPETYKPQLQEGSGRTQVVRVILIVSNAESVSLKIDPSVVLATRKYVDDNIIEVKAYADNLLTAHINAADPHTQYAPKASPTFTGTPVAPTPVKADNTTKLATTAFVKTVAADYAPVNSPALTGKPTTPTPAASANDTSIANAAFVKSAIAALVGSSPEALDTLNELAAALGNDPNFSTTMINALAGKLSKDQNGADIPDKERFLQNLQMGSAAKRNVGTGAGQIPDMSAWSSGGTSSAGWRRAPDGFIEQWGILTISSFTQPTPAGVTGTVQLQGTYSLNFPIPFVSQVVEFHISPMSCQTAGIWPAMGAYGSPNLSGISGAPIILTGSPGASITLLWRSKGK